MKKFLGILLISGAMVVLILELYYDRAYTFMNVSNALFLIGMPLFFLSIIFITNAVEVFVAIGYTFKKVYHRLRGYGALPSYYDFKTEREPANLTSFGIAGLLVSIGYLAVAFYIAYTYF